MSVIDEQSSKAGHCYDPLAKTKMTYSVQEIADILQISKSKAYELCKNPEFKIVRLGRTIRISKKSFDGWLNNLL